MLDILQSYLNDAATPEMAGSIILAHNAIERMGLDHYEKDFEEILMVDAAVDGNETLQGIFELTKKMLRDILLQHEIKLTDEADLDMLTLFTNGVLDITNFEDVIAVHDTACFEGSPEETYAELMMLVSDKTADELLYEIESVSLSLITRIKELSLPDPAPKMSDEERDAKVLHLSTFQHFIGLAGTQDLNVVRMLTHDGMDVGYPFAVYVGVIGRELEGMKPERAARELVGMAILSHDGLSSPRAVIKEHIDHYVSSIDTITQIDVEIGKLLLGLQK